MSEHRLSANARADRCDIGRLAGPSGAPEALDELVLFDRQAPAALPPALSGDARVTVLLGEIANRDEVFQLIDRDDVSVVVTKSARAESEEAAERLVGAIGVEVDDAGDDLEIEVAVPKRWNRHGSANLEIRVPRHLKVGVASGADEGLAFGDIDGLGQRHVSLGQRVA